MAHITIMPRQGNTVESCIITDWKVSEGDVVTAETMICEVETDKASFEVPAGAPGSVLRLLYPSGEDVPVLKPIAVIGSSDEDWKSLIGQEGSHGGTEALRGKEEGSRGGAGALRGREEDSRRDAEAQREDEEGSRGGTGPQNEGASGISPRARNLAAREALPLEGVAGTGPGHRIIERDVEAALKNRAPLTVAAKALGAAASPAVGLGLGGRVTAADLAAVVDLSAGADKAALAGASRSQSPLTGEGNVTETPIKGIRKVISERMIKSLAESAQFTLNSTASAVGLQEYRGRIKAQKEFSDLYGLSKITINDLVLFAVSRTLPKFPFMNAHKTGDTIRTFERIHLAVAVDTPRGLMVPVIRNANFLSLAGISSEAKRLAAACQNGTISPDELSGSTFTVTNLGGLGITSFTPVLNAPEVAILGVCGIGMKAIALTESEKGEREANCNCSNCDCCSGVRFEPHIGFSLTINHQAVDGAPAARFLQALGEAVADIDLLLAAG